jgi:hypothetical protein
VQREGFLEDALAAALEHPEVWPRLRRLAGWSELPEEPPESVATQEPLPGGRTDIVLRWANGVALVIELKAWDPLPTDGKLAHYASTGHRVTVIAPHPTVYPAPFLPMLTWARLRALAWPGAPLVWQQLCHLIEAVGVAVPRLELPAIIGLIPTWTARDVLEGWARPAVHLVQKQLMDGGWPCVLKEGRREERVEDAFKRFGFWAWPVPWNGDECLGVFCGIYLGKDMRDVLVPGVPDLRLMVHVNPKHATSAVLRADPIMVAAAAAWAGSSGGVTRQYDPESWYLLDARESLVTLALAEDQELAFRAWMLARAREIIEAGIVGRLAAVQR